MGNKINRLEDFNIYDFEVFKKQMESVRLGIWQEKSKFIQDMKTYISNKLWEFKYDSDYSGNISKKSTTYLKKNFTKILWDSLKSSLFLLGAQNVYDMSNLYLTKTPMGWNNITQNGFYKQLYGYRGCQGHLTESGDKCFVFSNYFVRELIPCGLLGLGYTLYRNYRNFDKNCEDIVENMTKCLNYVNNINHEKIY